MPRMFEILKIKSEEPADDVNVPVALAALWAMLKSNLAAASKLHLALSFDDVLGLGLRAWAMATAAGWASKASVSSSNPWIKRNTPSRP